MATEEETKAAARAAKKLQETIDAISEGLNPEKLIQLQEELVLIQTARIEAEGAIVENLTSQLEAAQGEFEEQTKNKRKQFNRKSELEEAINKIKEGELKEAESILRDIKNTGTKGEEKVLRDKLKKIIASEKTSKPGADRDSSPFDLLDDFLTKDQIENLKEAGISLQDFQPNWMEQKQKYSLYKEPWVKLLANLHLQLK